MTPPKTPWPYDTLKQLVAGERLPLMLVDLDVLDRNTRRLADTVAEAGMTLRVATKSIRVPDLIRRVMDVGGATLQGLMCFSVPEATLLHEHGFDDLLIAYPTLQEPDLELLWTLRLKGADVCLMIDCPDHAQRLQRFWAHRQRDGASPDLPVCIDLDVSYRPLSGLDAALGPHLGVRRSPVRDLDGLRRMLDTLRSCPALRLRGVMGYEAVIAGIGERNPFSPLTNPVMRLIKARSTPDVSQRRHAVRRCLDQEGFEGVLFNGGGTGSLSTTIREPWLTEVTAGSGFLQPHLFDYFESNRNEAAFCFALQVTRVPEPGVVTCHSGGFMASGDIGPEKAPVVMLPAGLKPISTEGFGEVQTPLRVPPQVKLDPGAPVFCRPAKAGEIAERFAEYRLMSGGELVGRAKTYRGLGHCFF